MTELLYTLNEVIEKEDGQEYIKDEGDTFHIKSKADALDMGALTTSLSESTGSTSGEHGIVDYGKVIKVIVPHEESLPSSSDTPKFNHKLFYSSLRRYQLSERDAEDWGNSLLYGEVVTSTNTLLEKYDPLSLAFILYFFRGISFLVAETPFILETLSSWVACLMGLRLQRLHRSLAVVAAATSG